MIILMLMILLVISITEQYNVSKFTILKTNITQLEHSVFRIYTLYF